MSQRAIKKYRKQIRQTVRMEKGKVNREFLMHIYAFKFFARAQIAFKILFRLYNKPKKQENHGE